LNMDFKDLHGLRIRTQLSQRTLATPGPANISAEKKRNHSPPRRFTPA